MRLEAAVDRRSRHAIEVGEWGSSGGGMLFARSPAFVGAAALAQALAAERIKLAKLFVPLSFASSDSHGSRPNRLCTLFSLSSEREREEPNWVERERRRRGSPGHRCLAALEGLLLYSRLSYPCPLLALGREGTKKDLRTSESLCEASSIVRTRKKVFAML